MRKIQLFRPIAAISFWVPAPNTTAHAINNTTTVLMAVAKLELTPSIPILAKMDVNAAKNADKMAYTAHIKITSFTYPFRGWSEKSFAQCNIGTRSETVHLGLRSITPRI
jgi:hypothetical protein